jgi:hypothetical protein
MGSFGRQKRLKDMDLQEKRKYFRMQAIWSNLFFPFFVLMAIVLYASKNVPDVWWIPLIGAHFIGGLALWWWAKYKGRSGALGLLILLSLLGYLIGVIFLIRATDRYAETEGKEKSNTVVSEPSTSAIQKVNGNPKFCGDCGSQLAEGKLFCQNCGAKVTLPASSSPTVSQNDVTPAVQSHQVTLPRLSSTHENIKKTNNRLLPFVITLVCIGIVMVVSLFIRNSLPGLDFIPKPKNGPFVDQWLSPYPCTYYSIGIDGEKQGIITANFFLEIDQVKPNVLMAASSMDVESYELVPGYAYGRLVPLVPTPSGDALGSYYGYSGPMGFSNWDLGQGYPELDTIEISSNAISVQPYGKSKVMQIYKYVANDSRNGGRDTLYVTLLQGGSVVSDTDAIVLVRK